jgi:hypothetical protein
MFGKIIRFIAVLAVIASVVGSVGIARAIQDEPPSSIVQYAVTPATSLGVQFLHVATTANTNTTTKYYTVIDHPLTNGKPNAIIMVTPNQNPGGIGNVAENHPIGVWYADGKWRIFNQDLTDMTIGVSFNVLIPTTGTNVFVHKASEGTGNFTYINNALTNDKPNAAIFITPNYNPGGTGGRYANFPIGVSYDGTNKKWAIYNRSGPLSTMPLNTAFNVFIPAAGDGIFVHTATAANIIGYYTTMDNTLLNSNPNALVFITPNYNPGGVGGLYDSRYNGVYYNGNKWGVSNQDGGSISANLAFNVLTLVPNPAVFVHTSTAVNSEVNISNFDHALTNSNPNAVVFVTQRLNLAGGVGGVPNNHAIGVYYEPGAKQWGVFNQDKVDMPLDAVFNVFVPNPDASVFVHKTTADNTPTAREYESIIDYPLTNGRPNAVLLITPNWNPGGVDDAYGVFDNHPIGVAYDTTAGKWKIVNQDLVAMPVNASFNVLVRTAGTDVFVHTANAGNSSFNYTNMDHALTNGRPAAIVFTTPNYNPGGVGGTYANFPIGVFYNSFQAKAAIFNQNSAGVIPSGAAFNVYIYANYKIYIPLARR